MTGEVLLDRAHLDAQTFGDEVFARELLHLFAEQCRRLAPGIATVDSPPDERADLAHTLKGAALGVGAARVAARSAAIEDALRARGCTAEEALRDFGSAIEATLAEIADPA